MDKEVLEVLHMARKKFLEFLVAVIITSPIILVLVFFYLHYMGII